MAPFLEDMRVFGGCRIFKSILGKQFMDINDQTSGFCW